MEPEPSKTGANHMVELPICETTANESHFANTK